MKKFINTLLLISILALPIATVLASEVTGNLSSTSGTVVVAPTANPSAGTYTSTQNVTLSAGGASSIHYTTDGSTPTCSTGATFSSAISVSTSQTIKALSCYPENHQSSVVSFAYTINTESTGGGDTTNTGGGGGGGGGGTTNTTITTGGGGGGGGGSLSFIPGDANRDGRVDILDFVILMANWGATDVGNIADFNNDNNVNIFDFVILMANWTI